MLDWLLKNKEWVFSGVGLAVIGSAVAIIRYILSRRGSAKGDQTNSGPSRVTLIDSSPVKATLQENPSPVKLTVKEIVECINNCPPFQREGLAKNYLGLRVNWEGKLWDVEKDIYHSKSEKEDLIKVNLKQGDMFHSILFYVPIEQYPQFKIARRGDLGLIRK